MNIEVIPDGKYTTVIGSAGKGKTSKLVELALSRAAAGNRVHVQSPELTAQDFMTAVNRNGNIADLSSITFTNCPVPTNSDMKDGDIAVLDFNSMIPVAMWAQSCPINLKEIIVTIQVRN